MRGWLAAVAMMLCVCTVPVLSQAEARIEVRLAPGSSDPQVQVRNLLGSSRWRDALDDAYKIAMEWRVELWRPRRWFDENVSTTRFTVVMYHEPLLDQYVMVTLLPGREPYEVRFNSLRDLIRQLELPITLGGVGPAGSGEWRYAARLRVQGMNESQYRELLRSDGTSSGDDDVADRVFRLLGLPTQTLHARTQQFQTGR